MAVAAGEAFGQGVGVFEGLAFGREFDEFGTGALSENGMAGVAIGRADLEADFADRLELFFGEASDTLCHIYARLRGARSTEGLRLTGSLTGPSCLYGRSLPATCFGPSSSGGIAAPFSTINRMVSCRWR